MKRSGKNLREASDGVLLLRTVKQWEIEFVTAEKWEQMLSQ